MSSSLARCDRAARWKRAYLLLARRDDGIGRQAIMNKFINVGFDELAVNYPGFFGQHVAVLITLGRIEKNVPGRAPLPRITG